MANEQISIGNVSFYKCDIKSSNVRYQDGQKINCVFLRNGTKMEFKDQKAESKANVVIGQDMSVNGQKFGTKFESIKGLYIEGTNKDDYYYLSHCEDHQVNVENGGQDEVRIVNHGKQKGTINADYNDKVSNLDLNNVHNISMNEGHFMHTHKTDIIKDIKPLLDKNGNPIHW